MCSGEIKMDLGMRLRETQRWCGGSARQHTCNEMLQLLGLVGSMAGAGYVRGWGTCWGKLTSLAKGVLPRPCDSWVGLGGCRVERRRTVEARKREGAGRRRREGGQSGINEATCSISSLHKRDRQIDSVICSDRSYCCTHWYLSPLLPSTPDRRRHRNARRGGAPPTTSISPRYPDCCHCEDLRGIVGVYICL